MTDELNFDLTPVEVSVTINEEKYLLCEADEATGEAFSNARMKGARMEGGKLVGLPTDLAGVQSLLVAGCLFQVGGSGEKVARVSLATVKGWPHRVVKPLFEKAKEISELDELQTLEQLEQEKKRIEELITTMKEEGEPAKNVPDATTDGSD